ncbi:hypothetical protein MUP37_05495 [Candidatus Bathyarchaeota archaeon]|nr:hypothetical protein [Candidatus Bathyarchaeota archaeon]
MLKSHQYGKLLTGLKIKVVPLAAESLGVRSMCTYVETPDLGILIDPGVSLGFRFGLLPHPKEYQAIKTARNRLAQYAEASSILTISHYHNDHATPSFTDYTWNFSDPDVAEQLYRGKTILAKDYRNAINPSQRKRGWILKERLENIDKSFEPADGCGFRYGKTTLNFSKPVPHGELGTQLGWVLMLSVRYDDDVFVHASDIQGPIVRDTVDKLLKEKPDIVYLGGPPTYLTDYRIREDTISMAFCNMSRVVENVPTVIVDHHLMRQGASHQGFEKVLSTGIQTGHLVLTAAEFLKTENSFLESRRKELYDEYPPSKEFIEWTKLAEERRMSTFPPA